MNLKTNWITYEGDNKRKYRAYSAKQALAIDPLPTVIVLQEFWGIDDYIRDLTHRFAQAGYYAIAPDLYTDAQGIRHHYLSEERVIHTKQFLDSIPPSIWRDVAARSDAMSTFSVDEQVQLEETITALFDWPNHINTYLEVVLQTTSYLRNECIDSKDNNIASVGFCLGGGISGLLACSDPQLNGAVIFYGNLPNKDLISQIQCPVISFSGDLDQPYSQQVPPFAQAMKSHNKYLDYYIYKDARHAFFNDTRPNYDIIASRDAFAKTIQFLNKVL